MFWNSEKKQLQAKLERWEELDRVDAAYASNNFPKIEVMHYQGGQFLSYDNSGDKALGSSKFYYANPDSVHAEVPRHQITHIEILTRGFAPAIDYHEYDLSKYARGAIPGRITIHQISHEVTVNCHRSIVDSVLAKLIEVWKHG